MASSGGGGDSSSSTNEDEPHHPDPHDRAAARQAGRHAGSSEREALGDEQGSSARRAAQEAYQRQLRSSSTGRVGDGDPQPMLGADATSFTQAASALPMHLQGFQSVSTGPGQSSLLFTHAPQEQQQQQHQHQQQQLHHHHQQQQQQRQRHLYQQQQQRQQPPQQQQHMPVPSPNLSRGGAGGNLLDSTDPFLDSLVNFEQEHGMMWNAWGSPSNLFASDSPPGALAFSGVVDDNGGGGGGGGNQSVSTTSRTDEGGGGGVPGFSTFPPAASSTAYRALPPLPSANAQQHPLPVQRTGSFDLPLVPPLLLGRHAGRASVVRSELNPHGGFIEREPALFPGGRERGRGQRGGSAAAATHVANPHVGQWQTAGHGGDWGREAIQSLLAAIPTVPPLAPPLGSSRGGMAPRSYSELRPPPLLPSLQRSLSAPLGSLGGAGGDGRAFAPQPHGLGSSHSDGGIQGSGSSLNSSLSEDPDRPFSFEASRGRERDSTVVGMSYGIGLNFPFAELDEVGRREYRRQRMLRWLEKRKRRTADRGITYSERSTLANRRQRISGRFVKQTNAFVSITELQRARARGAGGNKNGGGGGGGMYVKHEDGSGSEQGGRSLERRQQDDPDARTAGAFRPPKDEEDEDDDDDEEEEEDDSKQGEDDDRDDAEDGDFEQRPRR